MNNLKKYENLINYLLSHDMEFSTKWHRELSHSTLLLRHDVGSDLTPLFGDNDFIPFRNHRAVGIADHRTTGFEFKILVRVLSFLSEVSVDFHGEILIIKFFATVWQEGRIRGVLPSMAGCLIIQKWLGCSSMNSVPIH